MKKLVTPKTKAWSKVVLGTAGAIGCGIGIYEGITKLGENKKAAEVEEETTEEENTEWESVE